MSHPNTQLAGTQLAGAQLASAQPTRHMLGFTDFTQAVSESFVPLRVTSPHRDRFHGAINTAECDGVHFSLVEAATHTVERTPELIARADRSYFKLSLQLQGVGLLMQDGREAVLRPGDISIYTTDRPYSLEFDRDFGTLVMMVDHDTLDVGAESLREMTATRLAADSPLVSMVAPFLQGIAQNMSVMHGRTGVRMARTAVDLVTTMYSGELGERGGSSHKQSLLQSVMDYIDDHLGFGDLDPRTIAEGTHISLRYLHALFQEHGTTVSSWVKQRRLEHCRRDVTDPSLATEPVSGIGARWGFIDAAHFSRVFKDAYGRPPSQMRREALAPVAA